MKSDKQYFAEVQANIIKQVGKMEPEDRFARWKINIDGYDYSMYVMNSGAVGYIIPHHYDVISGINAMMPNMLNGVAPESVNSLVNNIDLIECKVVDTNITTVYGVRAAELRADGESESIWVNFKFFKKFYQQKENYSYKFSKFGVKQSLYIFRGDVLVAIILAIRQRN